LPARLLILVIAALLAVVPAACGGEDEDVGAILEETFSGDKQVDSGRLALTVEVDAEGSEQIQGPVSIEVAGPFQRRGENELPAFDLSATLRGAGVTYEAGAVSTGDAGFLRFQGQDYALSDEVFAQFRQGFEEARKEKQGDDGAEADLATLGIDPNKWLTNARVAGEAKVGDADTTRITGDVDVPKLLDDLEQAAEKARELDPDRKDEGTEITAEQRAQIEEAVQDVKVEIYTGEEDRILRRIVLDAEVRAPEGAEEFDTAKLQFDYAITELNEDQQIQAPENPKPFRELERQLEGLGLGGAPGRDSKTDQRDLERYTECVKRADDDSAAVQECADLL